MLHDPVTGVVRLTSFSNTAKSRCNEYRFKQKSRFKVQNLVIEKEIHVKKYGFGVSLDLRN